MKNYFGFTARVLAVLSLSLLLVNATANTANATRGGRDHKVTICHATNSQKNPYVVITVDKSAVDEPNNHGHNGHGDHTGAVWYQGIADHSWGDIIPAFTNDDGDAYPGMNWTTQGQTVYNNGCNTPKVQQANTPTPPKQDKCEPEETTTPPATTTPATPPKTDGHVLPASTSQPVDVIKGQELPTTLPDTGDTWTLAPWVILIASFGTYAATYWFTRKKAEKA